ncbi:IS110 family transposase [Ktedonobacter sp. SOSP1-52]|uniref:IS110 family transposase n=1 Tax=Ktedonobacter sp. SOSP1-52 TaxID=2778366 RepID=UPI001914DB0A
MRDLTRHRKTLVQERSQEINRLQKLLEGANIKLAAVAADVMGKSGRDMLEAVIQGEQDADVLAGLARGRLRAKLPDLRQALIGRVQPHHRFLLQQILAHIDFLEYSIGQVEDEVEQRLLPYEEAMTLLESIPGLQATAAAGILAEIGTDMSRFPSAKHLTSWAGVCPGSKVSAGKRLGGRTMQGDTHLQALLGEVAWAASHTKDTYLAAFYQRIARRRGKKKAVVALERKLLVIIYHMLLTKKPYNELGREYFDQIQKSHLEWHHIHRLEQLGYTVTLTPKEVA